jgi:hypothetical protein
MSKHLTVSPNEAAHRLRSAALLAVHPSVDSQTDSFGSPGSI